MTRNGIARRFPEGANDAPGDDVGHPVPDAELLRLSRLLAQFDVATRAVVLLGEIEGMKAGEVSDTLATTARMPRRGPPASVRPSPWLQEVAASVGTEAQALVEGWREWQGPTPEDRERIVAGLSRLLLGGRRPPGGRLP
jgi:hypothetical protein